MVETCNDKTFQPSIETVIYNIGTKIGAEIEVRNGKWLGFQFVPSGEPFRGTVIGMGDTYATVCFSRALENCVNCQRPLRNCMASLVDSE